MKIIKRFRKTPPLPSSVANNNYIWSPLKFSIHQYGFVILGLLIIAGGIAIFADTTPPTPPSPPLYTRMIGINGTHGDDYPPDAQALGAQWARVGQWGDNSTYEPTCQNSTQVSQAVCGVPHIANALANNNIHMLPLLSNYNVSFVQDGSCTGANYTGACTGKAAWVQAVLHAATTYGQGGTFWKGKADYGSPVIEVGNEVYGKWYPWADQGYLNPGEYAKMLKQASIAVKAASNGHIKLIASVISYYTDTNDTSKGAGGTTHYWAQDMKAAVPDIANYLGGVASHPYGDIASAGICTTTPCSTDTDWSYQQLSTIHSQWPTLPVYITEVGQKADKDNAGNGQVGYANQASAMNYYFNDFKNNSWEAGLFWYNDKDHTAYDPNTDSGWGLTDDTGFHKQAWFTYRMNAQSLENSTTPPVDTIAPTAPRGLRSISKAKSQTSVSLSWEASKDAGGSGLAGYKIYQDGTALASTQATTYLSKNLVPGIRYTFWVVAYDAAGNLSAPSRSIQVTTRHALSQP